MEEDGELQLSDVEMVPDDEETDGLRPENHDTNNTIFYKTDRNGLVVKKVDKIDASKLEERAKRFGINLSGSRLVTQKQIDELYKNFGIEIGNERHFRLDALHLSGISGLTTKDVFEYLQDYKPSSLEWTDDNSCNVICHDHISVALALLVHSREIVSEQIREMILEKSSYHWREGMPHPQVDMILMRFATNSDKQNSKKLPQKHLRSHVFDRMDNSHKNPWGDLCQSWGVYDHQEVFQRKLIKSDFEDNYDNQPNVEMPVRPILIRNEKLAKRLGKRNHTVNDEISSDSDSEWKTKSKTPRMRMHADDEVTKTKKKSYVEEKEDYAPLSIEVLNNKSIFRPRETKIVSEKFKRIPKRSTVSNNIQSRLGVKVIPESDYSSDGSGSDSSDHDVMSRVQKVKRSHGSSVWSRLDVKASNSGEQSDLRQVLKTKKHQSNDTSLKTNDLRQRLGKAKQANLRIEIDNS